LDKPGACPVSTRKFSTAADEVHDLQAVAFMQQLFGPRPPSGNLPVEFHGDTVSLQAELFDELSQGKTIGTIFGIAIDDDGHVSSVADGFPSSGLPRPRKTRRGYDC